MLVCRTNVHTTSFNSQCSAYRYLEYINCIQTENIIRNTYPKAVQFPQQTSSRTLIQIRHAQYTVFCVPICGNTAFFVFKMSYAISTLMSSSRILCMPGAGAFILITGIIINNVVQIKNVVFCWFTCGVSINCAANTLTWKHFSPHARIIQCLRYFHKVNPRNKRWTQSENTTEFITPNTCAVYSGHAPVCLKTPQQQQLYAIMLSIFMVNKWFACELHFMCVGLIPVLFMSLNKIPVEDGLHGMRIQPKFPI